MPKQQQTGAPLLDMPNLLMDITRYDRLYCSLASFEKLIKVIDNSFVLHIHLMLAVRHYIDLQFVMYFIQSLHFLIIAQSIIKYIYILIY